MDHIRYCPPRSIKNWLLLLNYMVERGPVPFAVTRRHPRELCILNGYAVILGGMLVITRAGRAMVEERRKEEIEDAARYRGESIGRD